MTEAIDGAVMTSLNGPPVVDLRGLRVMVTGASRGIGNAIARTFARGGASVACVSRTEAQIAELAGSLAGEGHRAVALPADLSDPAVASALPGQAADLLGGLDVIVNNAGISYPGGDRYAAWSAVLATNLTAPYLISEAAADIFVAQRRGRIINVGSILGLVMDHGCAHAYVASKHALIGLTKSFAVVCAPHNVQVNCVAPGYVRTAMTEGDYADPAMRQSVIDRTPAGRWAEADDVTGAVAFLASDSARHITGQTLVVDGGWTAL
jgi:NAD(P)-dependent dehydrogenase (short-subunit alcohol dehydrogenase family)